MFWNSKLSLQIPNIGAMGSVGAVNTLVDPLILE